MIARNIFSITIAVFSHTYQNSYQFTCIEQKAPGNSKVHMSLQVSGSSSMELVSCHPSGTYNLEVAPRFCF
jgi:hypothetical protein